jgi:hypothetical protein
VVSRTRRHSPIDILILLGILGLLFFIGNGCTKPQRNPDPVSGFTEGTVDPPPILECPGETQCPCTLPAADTSGGASVMACPGVELVCGPTHACTMPCRSDADCTSGVSGEACIGGGAMSGRCGVPCDPEAPSGGCVAAGMPGSRCIGVFGTYACGY